MTWCEIRYCLQFIFVLVTVLYFLLAWKTPAAAVATSERVAAEDLKADVACLVANSEFQKFLRRDCGCGSGVVTHVGTPTPPDSKGEASRTLHDFTDRCLEYTPQWFVLGGWVGPIPESSDATVNPQALAKRHRMAVPRRRVPFVRIAIILHELLHVVRHCKKLNGESDGTLLEEGAGMGWSARLHEETWVWQRAFAFRPMCTFVLFVIYFLPVSSLIVYSAMLYVDCLNSDLF
jgi:hypothetical protein